MPNDRRPMDIRCKTLFTVLCALMMMLFPPFTAHAEETAGTDSVIITFDMSGAPAGTVPSGVGGLSPRALRTIFFAPFREVGLNAPEPRIYWAKPVLCRSADGEVLRNLKTILRKS